MTYDNEGRFRPQAFEDIFSKYDKGNKGGLDKSDVLDMLKGQRMVFDFFGWSATFLECKVALLFLIGYHTRRKKLTHKGTATYLLLWPDDGVMKKEDIRRIYDGSIFYKKAEEYQQKQRAKAGSRSSTSPRLMQRARKTYSSLLESVENDNPALAEKATKVM